MYEYLKERKSEGKFTKAEEIKFASIADKIGKLYESHNTRMKKIIEKESRKQVKERISSLSIKQQAKLLSLIDSVETNAEEAITENPETLNEELKEV